MSPPDIEAGDMRSGLKADYSLWPPLSFKPLEQALVEELIDENPALPTQIVVIGAYWPTADLTITPTSTPSVTPTASPTASATALPVRPPATRRPQPNSTQVAAIPSPVPPSATIPAPTPTRQPNTQQPNQTDSPPNTSTSTNTATQTSTSTNTSTATLTNTPTATASKIPAATATSTRGLPPIATNTNTPTPTRSLTPTNTLVPPTTRTPPTDGINIGLPDRRYSNIFCESPAIIDLGAPTQIGTLIFYEFLNPEVCYYNSCYQVCKGGICLNWVIIDLSETGDSWSSPGTQRSFYWGDSEVTNNGNIPATYFPTERSGVEIPPADLYNGHGIQIHVDGVYRYIRVAPPTCSNYAQLDSIEIWAATMTPRP
jgi:hypothetical protein